MNNKKIKNLKIEYNNETYHIVASKVYCGDINSIKKERGNIVLIDNDLKICNKDLEWVTIITEDKLKNQNEVINADDIIVDKDTTLTEYIDKIKEESNSSIESLKDKLSIEKEEIELKIENTNKEVENIKSKEYVSKEELNSEVSEIEKRIEEIGSNNGGENPEVIIESSSEYVEIKEVKNNHYEITTKKLEEELKGLKDLVKELMGEESEFLGNIKEYDFKPVTDNDKIVERKFWAGNIEATIDNDVGEIMGIIELNRHTHHKYVRFVINENSTFEPTTKRNIFVTIINNQELPTDLDLNSSLNLLKNPRYENELTYKDGDFKIPEKGLLKVQFTIYTDPNGNVIRTYLKKIKEESLE